MKKIIILLSMALITCSAMARTHKTASKTSNKKTTTTSTATLSGKELYEKAKRLDEADEDLASYYYEQAAKTGYSKAMIVLGNMAYHDDDYEEAAEWYDRAAAAGNPEGYINHGELFRDGEGEEQDFETYARYCLKAAALSKDGNGFYEVGRSYYNGKGVDADFNKALHWCVQGGSRAVEDLGLDCMKNNDTSNMITCFKKMIEMGDYKGALRLAEAYEDGDGGLAVNTQLAMEWYRKGIESGSKDVATECANNLAYIYERQENPLALPLYKKAAEMGYNLAYEGMADCYYNGTGTTQNYAEALRNYELAAKTEGVSALKAAHMYLEGEGTAVSTAKAAPLLAKAVQHDEDLDDEEDIAACSASVLVGSWLYEDDEDEDNDSKTILTLESGGKATLACYIINIDNDEYFFVIGTSASGTYRKDGDELSISLNTSTASYFVVGTPYEKATASEIATLNNTLKRSIQLAGGDKKINAVFYRSSNITNTINGISKDEITLGDMTLSRYSGPSLSEIKQAFVDYQKGL
ncbi:MAG: sel1 repeat family protein [Muribaculaceae bacterium]|nr:sel1 repeat family protein [Muribaculaceae bacterium]